MSEQASSGLFSIFVLTIYSLLLIPVSVYWLCSEGNKAQTTAKVWCLHRRLLLLSGFCCMPPAIHARNSLITPGQKEAVRMERIACQGLHHGCALLAGPN